MKKKDRKPSDMWSVGVLVYRMFYGKLPFAGKDAEEIIKNM